MRTIYYKLLRLTNQAGTAEFANFEFLDNIEIYVTKILVQTANAAVERKYKFKETLHTTKDRIYNLLSIAEDGLNPTMLEMGNHLSSIEKEFNDNNPHLKGKIPDGVLLIAYVDMETDEGDYKIIILKSDYDEFIAEHTGQQSTGLSLKNQIFKTCQFNVRWHENTYEIMQIAASDSTKRQAAYWLKDFLELEAIRQDKENTEKAYDLIKKKILNPLKENHKPDFLILYNSTISYMRSDGMFDMDYYRDEIIGNYRPYDNTLDVNDLKSKLNQLRDSDKFDAQFIKVPTAIKDKLKSVIKLTDELYLNIKHDIPGMDTKIQPYDQGQKKGITIISQEGYEFAKGVHRRRND